ncbi:MAG: TolC family protein [Bryobacterales bacterium]|nr:TolC family protein [Bryobacterales bacterium]
MQRVLILLFAVFPLFSQVPAAGSGMSGAAAGEPLSLREAATRALGGNPGLEALQAGERAASSQVDAAKSGYFPRVNYQEMAQRGNNPVYVFGALLTQRQFGERNFAIPSLNRPDFLNNFQSMVTVDQVVYNAGRTRNAVRGAELGRQMGELETKSAELNVMQRVLEAYFGAKLGEAAYRAAEESVRSAEADLERAEAFRREGMTTDADVLSIRVHLASVRQEAIQRRTQLEVARAALNVAMGEAEDAAFQLTTPLMETAYEAAALADSQNTAVDVRPELLMAMKGIDVARVQERTARAGYWPEVFVRGVFETDRQEVLNKGGANWFFGAGLRWNVFNGMETKAHVAESRHRITAAEAQQRQAAAGVRFEVRRAWLEWNAVKERLALASASVAEAEESLRITRDRYQNGLSTVTDLLRTETAVLGAKTGYLAALYEQRVAAARLEAARGSLNPASLLFD